ncbi:hypothetical protein EDF46_2522 [Frondihabitans sp. PhB188]|uniref:DUF6049 family protein n=1 Tax=Frondihabitans sp. PhB188 TaxID=2485200 RepID=UPI000F48421B|nr:DUF6049 family protein [Frondihabitans sp. PhB188]ROQ37076.1 hypothetical protein EDF46_2522 [Frondihabitans sp. PhB188]
MRILSALAVAALAVAALGVGLPVLPATAAAADGTVTVSVSPRASGVIRDGDGLKATVTVHNGTDADLDAGTAQVFLDRATFSSRDQIDAWFDRSASDTRDALGSFMTSVAVPSIDAGATSSAVTIDLSSETLSLNGYDWGAKAFGVRYSSGGAALTEAHSSVVWYPNDSFQATRLAVAVPLTVPESTSGLISSEALASYTSENGVLTQELDAVRNRDVAIGIDPMILASIRILGNVAPPSSITWLRRLETATNETFSLSYGDSDISAMRQAGATTLQKPIDFTDAIAAQEAAEPDSYVATDDTTGAGQTPPADATAPATEAPTGTPTSVPPTSTVPTTESLLAFAYTESDVAWPLEGTVASGDLPIFKSSGVKTTVLSSSNVSTSSDTTENAAIDVSSYKTVVSDAEISSMMRDAVSAGSVSEWRSDVAQLSAELATLTHERPSDARTLFATLGRNWATTGSRLDETLDALATMNWVSTVRFSAAASASSSDATLAAKKASASRVSALEPLVEAQDDLQRFSTALKTPSTVTAKERLRVLALSGTAWSDNPSGLASEVAKVRTQVDRIRSQIGVVQSSDVNILGDRSSLPIFVRNDTASAATVYLRVQPSNYYLSVQQKAIAVTIQPDSQTRVTVPVQSVANGKVMLTLSLATKDGVTVSTPSEVAINVRAGWETVITAIFAAAVVLLFGGGIYRSIRRRRRGKSGDEGDDATTPDPAAGT